jgi:hypothetical protein
MIKDMEQSKPDPHAARFKEKCMEIECCTTRELNIRFPAVETSEKENC